MNAETGECPCLAGTMLVAQVSLEMALPLFCCLAGSVSQGFLSACSFPMDVFCLCLLSCTPPPHLTLQPQPSGPLFTSFCWHQAVQGTGMALASLWSLGVFLLRDHLLRASSGSWPCISQSRWVLCCPVSAAHMASCPLVTMAPVQPRGDSTV